MKQNILIVDDDKDICLTLSKILTSKGFQVTIANNSDAAINVIKSSSIDLVLLDVWLEGSKKDGLELLKIIKKYNPITPVILISGHANVEMAVKAIKLGAFYFIEKPFKSEKLFLIMDRAIENAFLKKFVSDLGVCMCQDGHFKIHIHDICISARKTVSWICRTFKSRSVATMSTAWKSLVLPKLEYCSQLWCPIAKGDIQKLKLIQRNLVRKMNFNSHFDYWEILSILNMYSLQ